MRFLSLLKKELRSILTFQTLMSLLISLVAFFFFGKFLSNIILSASEKSADAFTVVDMDRTTFTKEALEMLAIEENLEINTVTSIDEMPENRADLLDDLNVEQLMIIPKGLSESVENFSENAGKIEVHTVASMNNTSMMGMISNIDTSGISRAFSEICSNLIVKKIGGISIDEQAQLENIVGMSETTVVMGKSAQISRSDAMAFSRSQSTIVPVIVFILIIFAAQMIITAISTEKIDKTLETLLSTPVKRTTVLLAKILSAGLVALLNAVVYMIGFSSMMSFGNISTGDMGAVGVVSPQEALSQLGLVLGGSQFILLGLQVFLSIMIALSVALILGVLVEDSKSAQSVVTPLLVCALIPYMLSIFSSINELPLFARIILFLDPFTHTFVASENIMFGRMTEYWLGVGYQIIVLIVAIFAALKLFQSDKLFTTSLNFSKGKKRKVHNA